MKTSLLALVCCLSLGTVSAQSGILKTIGGAAKTKVEQQDFNSTRSNKEKGQLQDDSRKQRSIAAPGSVPESAAPAPAPPSDTASTPAPAGGTIDSIAPSLFGQAKYNASYTFNQRLRYVMEDLSKTDDRDTVTYYYSDGAILSQFEGKKQSTLVDFSNESMIDFDEKEKTAMAMSYRWATQLSERRAAKDDAYTVTKTGQKKQILGYNCEEYVIEGKTKSVCWITTEVKADHVQTMTKHAQIFSGAKNSEFANSGLLMEVTGYDKKGTATTHMIAIDYRMEILVKELAGYTVTTL